MLVQQVSIRCSPFHHLSHDHSTTTAVVVGVVRRPHPGSEASQYFYRTRCWKASISDTTTTTAATTKSIVERDTTAVVSTSRMLGAITPLPLLVSSSSFVEAMQIPTFLCSGGGLLDNNNNNIDAFESPTVGMVAQNITWNHPDDDDSDTTDRSSSSSRYGPAMTISSVLTPFMCQDIIQACDMAIYNSHRLLHHQHHHRNITSTTTDIQPPAATTTTPPFLPRPKNNKNQHGAMQLLVSHETADTLAQQLAPYIPISNVEDRKRELERHSSTTTNTNTTTTTQLRLVGMNRRWRVYKYAPNHRDQFLPHIDAGFPPSGISTTTTTNNNVTTTALQFDDTVAYLDRLQQQQGTGPFWWSKDDDHNVTLTNVVSRLTILFYLNDNFTGGTTNFYEPLALQQQHNNENDTTAVPFRMIASIVPQTGMVLIFPQCVGAEVLEQYARYHWPTHEGSPVHKNTMGSESKYVIRSDLLFAEVQVRNENPKSRKVGTEDGL